MMQRFFNCSKSLFHTMMNTPSYQLLELMIPSKNGVVPNPEGAREFVIANQDKPLDFYLKKLNIGLKMSSLHCFVLHDKPGLVEAALKHPSLKKQKNHDWNEVMQCIKSAVNKPSTLSQLTAFYKPRLPIVTVPDFNRKELNIVPLDSPIDSFEHYFWDFPEQEIWRLFIDGNKQRCENGWLDYELREPGCIEGMVNGFLHLKNHINEELTVELLQDLHAACTSNVDNLSGAIPGEFRDNEEVFFGINSENGSAAGLIEIIERQNREDLTYKLDGEYFHARAQPAHEIYHNVKKLIDNYQQSLTRCTTIVDKINAIIELVFSLERLHPFQDGNCRTFCIFLLNRELIRNGLSPVILDDPNRFDGFSKNELLCEIHKGMLVFNQVKNEIINNLGISTPEIKSIIQDTLEYAPCIDAFNYLKINSIDLLDIGLSMRPVY